MAHASIINSSSFTLAHLFISLISFGHSGVPLSWPPFLELSKQNREARLCFLQTAAPVVRRHSVISEAAIPAKLHAFGVKVPHFTLTSHTNFRTFHISSHIFVSVAHHTVL